MSNLKEIKLYSQSIFKGCLLGISSFNLMFLTDLIIFFAISISISKSELINVLFEIGKFSDISPSAKLKIENFNKDGKLHGESILYYQDESVVEQGNYKNGKKDGEWIFRGENGAYQKYNYE